MCCMFITACIRYECRGNVPRCKPLSSSSMGPYCKVVYNVVYPKPFLMAQA